MKTSEITYGEEYKLNGITFGLIEDTDTDITIEYELNGKYYLHTIETTDKMENEFPFNEQINKIETMQQRINRFKNNYNGERVL